jgi:hypothetical protein
MDTKKMTMPPRRVGENVYPGVHLHNIKSMEAFLVRYAFFFLWPYNTSSEEVNI